MAKAKKGKKAPSQARVAAMEAAKLAKEAGSEAEQKQANAALKQLKFREIVVPRVNRCIKVLKQLEKMGRAASYKWDAEQGSKIAAAVLKQAQAVHAVYTGATAKDEVFTL